MNLAFKRQMTPAMYFLLMGGNWPFDRFGDIWCGLFVKKICDHLGLVVRSGLPHVKHVRASDVWSNLKKELPGYTVNESLWEAVDSVRLTKSSVRECYTEIAEKLDLSGEYWDKVRKAMRIWAALFPAAEESAGRGTDQVNCTNAPAKQRALAAATHGQ